MKLQSRQFGFSVAVALVALVALKKKLEVLWGDEDESTPRRSGP